ncbi:MobF family relaxase [Nonomuraea sp. NPDC023979]|uniref:MobF family relaxase n=1 Tax=Nonomuraea sp. NPDC023979 TaxID=3154796 RepID=UPI0033BFDCB7
MLSIGLGYDPGYLTRQVGKGAENYYLSSIDDAERGEPPGVWSGRACAELGFTPGEPVNPEAFERLYRTFADPRDPAFNDPAVPEDDKPRLGHRPTQYRQDSGRKPVYFLDLTFSPPKTVTLLHAGLLARAATERHAGHEARARTLESQAEQVWDAVMAGNAAMLEYYQDVCGVSRAGRHGPKVEGRTTGRWVDAPRWVVASFRQHTSRNGDPQLHVHNPVLNRVPCDIDGKWRTLDSRAIHAVRPAAGALAERVMWEHLVSRLPIRTRIRQDGHGLEVEGIADDLIDQFSSRRVEVSGLLDQLRGEYLQRHGREPSARALFSMAQYATRATKRRKSKAVAPTHAAELDQWLAQSRHLESGTLSTVPDHALNPSRDEAQERQDARAAQLAQRVLTPPAPVQTDPAGQAGWDVDEQIEHILTNAIRDAQRAKAVFSRFEVMRAINRHLPGALGGLEPVAVRRLLEELTDQALRDKFGVRLLNLPDLVEVPAELRRADGSSMYEAPCAQRFTTDQQLATEEALLAAAKQRTAPAIPAEQVEDWLAPRRRAPSGGRGLREDQAAAIAGIASSGRAVDVFEGPAGSGKSFVLAQLTSLWRATQGAGSIGLTLSSNASYVLAGEGFQQAFNIRRFLTLIEAGKFDVEPGTLIVVDEASMVSTADLAAIQKIAAKARAKVVWAGDTRQLSSIEAGGLMRVLAADAGSHVLTVVERMRTQWERAASLKLRAADVAALHDYDEHNRIIEGDREQVTSQLVTDYLGDRAAGRRALLLAPSNADAAELSARVRAERVRQGQVTAHGLTLHDGNVAGIGDLVTARANTKIRIGVSRRTLSNRDELVVQEIHADGSLVAHLASRRHPGGDPARPVYLPAGYVAKHVELGYASTVHAAQGRTVDAARALIDSRVSLQMLYVMMTRGRRANLAYVDVGVRTAADLRDGSRSAEQLAGPDPAPGAPTRTALTVLADILERDDATPAAIEALRGESDRVSHMAHLLAMWTDAISAATRRRYEQVLAAELGPDLHARLRQDPAQGSLYALLHQADLGDHDSAELVRKAVRSRSFDGVDSIAQVLRHRLRRLMTTETEQLSARASRAQADEGPLQWRWSERTPRLDEPELHRFATELAEQMDQRIEDLGQRAAQDPPTWALDRLGEVPADPLLRHEWVVRAGVAASYGEAFGVPVPPAQPPAWLAAESVAAWRSAHHALTGLGRGLAPPAPIRDGDTASPAIENLAAAPGRSPAPARQHGPDRDASTQARDAVRRASAKLALARTRYGVGLLAEAELDARLHELAEQLTAAADRLQAAEQERDRYARGGGGPAERELLATRDRLAEQIRRIDAATVAVELQQRAQRAVTQTAERLNELRQREQTITAELDALRPWQRARNRELAAELSELRQRQAHLDEVLPQARQQATEVQREARQAVEQAAAPVTWPLVRQRYDALTLDFDSAQRQARLRDTTTAAQQIEAARHAHAEVREELVAVQAERDRRAALPADRREVEQAVRAAHADRTARALSEPGITHPDSGRHRAENARARGLDQDVRDRDGADRERTAD